MDEPTDRAIRIQGLKRVEYESMSREGKAVVATRSRRLVELANLKLAAELLSSLAESDNPSRAYIAETLDGKHPDFEEKLREILRDYLDADVETGIREFYKIRYGSKGVVASSVAASMAGDGVQPQEQPAAPKGPYAKPKTFLQEMESGDAPQPPTQATPPQSGIQGDMPAKEESVPERLPQEVPGPVAESQAPKPSESEMSSADLRRRAVAAILSRREKRDVDSVMKSEADVIGYVMTVADENAGEGVTDEAVCQAVEAMISNGIGQVQFYREALMPANREALLRIAKTFK